MIKLSIDIPFDVDVSNPDDLKNFLVVMRQYVEELASKAKSFQETIYKEVPTADDIEEGEDAPFKSGATIREYTKTDGTVGYKTVT